MDAYLAVVGKREVRRYEDPPVPEPVLAQILEAGRASGSSRNRQPWRFETAVKRLLGIPDEMAVPTILSLGYPAPGERRPRPKADPSKVLARIDRLPLADLVHREAWS